MSLGTVYGNGGLEAAYAAFRLQDEDERRKAWLNEACKRTEPRDDECVHGHPLDGLKKARGGKWFRYCKRCAREQMRRARLARRQLRNEGQYELLR